MTLAFLSTTVLIGRCPSLRNPAIRLANLSCVVLHVGVSQVQSTRQVLL
jgi:hypothetical protein